MAPINRLRKLPRWGGYSAVCCPTRAGLRSTFAPRFESSSRLGEGKQEKARREHRTAPNRHARRRRPGPAKPQATRNTGHGEGNRRGSLGGHNLLMAEGEVPSGTHFLDLVRVREERCEELTERSLLTLGIRASQTYEALGAALSLLDRVASCFWGCAGGDHAIERLAGRAESNSCAALRLLRAGFYDESLGLARGVGEVCNLLQLFVFESGSLDEWRSSGPQDRRNAFSPVKVRHRIETVADRVIVESDRYGQLSGFTAHPDPDRAPQAHNILGIPSTGGLFQEAGLLMALNELGFAVASVVVFTAVLSDSAKDHRQECKAAGVALLNALGGVEVLRSDEMWGELRTSHPQDE